MEPRWEAGLAGRGKLPSLIDCQLLGSVGMRGLPVFAVLLMLGACGDPLAGVGRLTEVDVAEENTAAAALPDAAEVGRDGFVGTQAAEGEVPSGLPQADAADTTKAPTGGFFRGLINRAANADPAAAVAADVAKSQSEPVIIETTPTTSASAAETATSIAPKAEEPAILAALPDQELSPREELKSRKRGVGLFGGSAAKKDAPRKGPDARDVPYGTVLAFGEIARVCEARGKSLGKKVGSSGRRGFSLHDTNPNIRDKRTFYLTGFDDNCPRQFTAANALFGEPSFYEQIRFSPAGKHLPYAATDKAYDKVKSRVCRTAKNKPCGSQISKMDASAAFVSAYEFHEHNGKWKEFFVHDGVVLASAVKSAN
jgi:hypothetical protein